MTVPEIHKTAGSGKEKCPKCKEGVLIKKAACGGYVEKCNKCDYALETREDDRWGNAHGGRF